MGLKDHFGTHSSAGLGAVPKCFVEQVVSKGNKFLNVLWTAPLGLEGLEVR